MKKPRFLPFWAVGLSILILYVIGLFLIPRVDKIVPALPNAAALGEASALVGSFLTVISIFFLLYTIHLQQKIRNEEAIETHWFELLKRWAELAEDREFQDRAAEYEGELSKLMHCFQIADSADNLSEQKGLEEIANVLAQEGIFELPSISETLDRLFAAMMTLRERVSASSRDLLDNSFLPFVPKHIVEALVYSALFRADQKSLRTLTRLGLVDRAVIYASEPRWFLTRHYGTAQQRKEKARARQREKEAHPKDGNDAAATTGQDQS